VYTEDLSSDAENSALALQGELEDKLRKKTFLHYFSFLLYFDSINAVLVSIRDFQNHSKSYDPKLFNSTSII